MSVSYVLYPIAYNACPSHNVKHVTYPQITTMIILLSITATVYIATHLIITS